jgi:hypothetical protein
MNGLRHVGIFTVLLLAALAGGCSSTHGTDPDAQPDIPVPEKTYKGLAGQRCAIMIWANYRDRTEYGQIQLDLARSLEKALTPKPSEDKDAKKDQQRKSNAPRFLDERSVVRFQHEHPEIDGLPITEVAPRLGYATRIIYVELEQFELRSSRSIMILKGNAKATLRVVEVYPGGKASSVFEEHGIEADYPPNAPEGVVETDKSTPTMIYEGLITRLAQTIAVRFEEQGKD